jgi:hypothetical protein
MEVVITAVPKLDCTVTGVITLLVTLPVIVFNEHNNAGWAVPYVRDASLDHD